MTTELWHTIQAEARHFSAAEPSLASFFHGAILHHADFAASLSFILAQKLDSHHLPAILLRQVIEDVLSQSPDILLSVKKDIFACIERDPACSHHLMPLLYFKGFHALQAYRIAHALWNDKRRALALFFQNQISQTFCVDIHPAAKLGTGIMIDHATGVVIGETAVVGDDVSLLHGVTLGGSGYAKGDRHPKIGSGVLISAGAKLLGNICIGQGAKIAAGSVVLVDVAAHTTVAGVPAKVVGKPKSESPAREMNHSMSDDD
ncbi:serine O-acetyltransferase [Simiduia litorea]|uniref:serine O-acetyltransferase n=1 Tax=Simiduia litorea TaxID=1435348 RepID=UPI0036F20F38